MFFLIPFLIKLYSPETWYAKTGILKVFFTLFEVEEYDELPQRFKRIRHQLIDGLKQPGISDSQRTSTVADIKQIDAIVNNLSEHTSMMAFVFNHLIPSRRRADRSKSFQQDIETMLANDLYLKATELEQFKL